MSIPKRRPSFLGEVLFNLPFFVALFFILATGASPNAVDLQSSYLLLQHGVRTQAVITGMETIRCHIQSGKSVRSVVGQEFSVRFTDQTGQVHTNTISCDYNINASPGDSVTIVYRPDDPTFFTPLTDLRDRVQNDLGTCIVFSLFALVSLAFWIRGLIQWIIQR